MVLGRQRRGVGLYWETYEKAARNPLTGESVTAARRRVKIDMELPMRDEYSAFVGGLLSQSKD